MNAIGFVLAASLAVPAAVLAQEKTTSLAEQAEKTKKDREKRKAAGVPGSAKVITNDDLRSAQGNVIVLGGVPASAPAPGAPGTPAAAAGATAPTDAELRDQKRADLQAQLDAQADLIKRLRESADQTQTELNDLGNYVFGGRRAALAQIVEERQKQVAEAERAIADLEEQARRAGVSLSRP
jgi:hypothetical protein